MGRRPALATLSLPLPRDGTHVLDAPQQRRKAPMALAWVPPRTLAPQAPCAPVQLTLFPAPFIGRNTG